MKKYVCIIACMISACATIPERSATSTSSGDVGNVERKIFDVATKCWAKEAGILSGDGYKVVDGRANGVYRIETYSYAQDGRGQTQIVIEISKQNDQVVLTARQPALEGAISSTPSPDLDMRWQDANNWIKGNYTCAYKQI